MSNSIDVSGDRALHAPLFKHDCDHCIFLGTTSCWREGVLCFFDLYFHPADSLDTIAVTETVIARFGPDGEYFSGLHFAAPYTDVSGAALPGMPMLVEAKRRAVELGLLASLPA